MYEHAARARSPITDLGILFRRLRDCGLSLGVATSDSTRAAEAALESANVAALVQFVAGYDASCGAKPSPAVVEAFCAHTGSLPGQVAVVGDSASDGEMARAAGAGLAIGVLTGTTPRARLAASVDHVIDSVADLEELLS